MYKAIKPLLYSLNPETAHHLALNLIKLSAKSRLITNQSNSLDYAKPTTALGMTFRNPVGLAAGFDKNGECVEGLSRLGFGFVEVGTLTPKPQKGNAKPRLFRLSSDKAIINRMGFNNKGIDYFVNQIKKQKYTCKLGVNIGKNKDTPNQDAHLDYLYCFEKSYLIADYIVINISSPNTPNLRSLQKSDELIKLLTSICELKEKLQKKFIKAVPLLVKISPDLNEFELNDLIESVNNLPIQGVIATNTTIERINIQSHLSNEMGGLSGAPLTQKSNAVLKHLKQGLSSQIDLIGVGGIMSPENAIERFNSGANLVQIYSGLIYFGPHLIKEILKKI